MCKQLFGEKKVSYKASGSKTGVFILLLYKRMLQTIMDKARLD